MEDKALREISFEMAVNIGLIPKSSFAIDSYSGKFFLEREKEAEARQERGERRYTEWRRRAIDKFCHNKKLLLCKFSENQINQALDNFFK